MNIRTGGIKQRADGSRYMVGLEEDGREIKVMEIQLPPEAPYDLTADINFIRTGQKHE